MSAARVAPDGFLSRWSQRKVKVRQGQTPAEPATVVEPPPLHEPDTVAAAPPETPVVAEQRPPPLTLDDVAQLGRDSDYRRFVAADVTPEVKNAALKKLFADPHFNVMDGLDTYIDDYGKPDPIPASMLRQMVQSHALGLFADEQKDGKPPPATVGGATPDGAPAANPAQSDPEPAAPITHDQDAALRLQPLDAAGSPGAAGGAGQDPGRQR